MSPITETKESVRLAQRALIRRTATLGVAIMVAGPLVGCAAGASVASDDAVDQSTSSAAGSGTDPGFDLTSASATSRPHLDAVPEAIAALEAGGFEPVSPGKLTVAINGSGTPPTSFLAEDDVQTIIGSDSDIASLIADGLDLEYTPVNVAWADWPLGVESGKYDLVLANVGVTEERKDLFDFATYRDAIMAFIVADGSDITEVSEPEDVAGLQVIVGSGTNQEAYLLDWFAQNDAAGIESGEPVYYEDQAAGLMALTSGRADLSIQPYSLAAYQAQTLGETRIVGKFNSAYPVDGQVGVATAKGNGLIEPVSIVLSAAIADGQYAEVLERWGQAEEAVPEVLVNPPGLPRP